MENREFLNKMQLKKFTCRVSGNPLEEVVNLGRQPLGNGFVEEPFGKNEFFYSMSCGFDSQSGMFQLLQQPEPSTMFHQNYAFLSSTSTSMVRHFSNVATTLCERYLGGNLDPLVVEIGCNDGVFLQNIAHRGYRHIGVEPSENVALIAKAKGLNIYNSFFSHDLACEIKSSLGKCDLIYAANVMCHIPEINDVFRAVESLIADDGVFVFEDPYLGDVIERNSYDQIYDEHVFLFSAISIDYLCKQHGLELINLEKVWTHGGSMRYHIAKEGRHAKSESVTIQVKTELKLGLARVDTYFEFAERVKTSRLELLSLLSCAREQGKVVYAYGATSKSTTIYNYCGIDSSLISRIVDNTPTKIGKYSPGVHIPISDRNDPSLAAPDLYFLAAWNHREEIMSKEKNLLSRGVKFITHVPRVGYIND